MRVSNWRFSVKILILLASVALSIGASCTLTKGRNVTMTSVTEQSARVHLINYFQDTLRSLPASVFLALEPVLPGDAAPYDVGNVVPCDDNDRTATGPVNLGLYYWVHGVKPEANVDYFRKIVDIWREWSWSVEEDSTSGFQRGRATAPDNYSLTVVDNGLGGLSMIGSSPCFTRSATGGGGSQPSTIAHP